MNAYDVNRDEVIPFLEYYGIVMKEARKRTHQCHFSVLVASTRHLGASHLQYTVSTRFASPSSRCLVECR